MNKRVKVFIGMYEVANYYNNLKISLDSVGMDNDFYLLAEHPFGYKDNSKKSFLVKLIREISLIRFKYIAKYAIQFLKILLFLRVVFKYDVFIFANGGSFMKYLDYKILFFLKKKIVVIFHGSDVRYPYSGTHSVYNDFEECFILTQNRLKTIRKIERYSTLILNIPPQAVLCEKEFINSFYIGMPFSYSERGDIKDSNIVNKENKIKNNKVKILHAPSVPEVKGTDIILRIIEELKIEGFEIEFKMITKRPFSEVVECLRWCDFVVDELYSDSPMAGLATEAAYFEKPTITCGYYAKYIKEDVLIDFIPPSEYVEIENLKESIVKLYNNEEYRHQLGKNAKKFLDKEWSIHGIGLKFKMLINDDYPKHWIYNPKKIEYFYGAGVPKEKQKLIFNNVVKQYGKEGLFLSHNPNLENKIIEFIKE